MMALRSRVITESLGGSSLSLAVQQRQLPTDLQPWWPATLDEWREHVAAVRGGSRAGWFEALRPAMLPTGAAARRLERAVAEHGVVVTTGQQPGLFGGPLYTLAKALTAVALADALEQHLGVTVAPVFWAATDDADFLEASVTHVADADGLHALALESAPPAGTPMSLAPFGSAIPLLERLRKACGSASYGAFYEYARLAYTQQTTVGGAYVQLLRDLLAPTGMAVLDSSHPSSRDAARPILVEAMHSATELVNANAEREAKIRKVGFEPQVVDDRGLSLVFVVENGIRKRLSAIEARTLAAGNPRAGWFSPNVLLRPIVEKELLPTVGYVAGPGELAYFTQANAVASAMRRGRLVGLPRWSCTIIEPFADKALRRLRLRYDQLRNLRDVERRLAAAAIPPAVADAWRRLQEQLGSSLHVLGDAVRDAALMPPEVIQGLERSLTQKLQRGERRMLAAVKRRDERVHRDLQTVTDALYPLGRRQERVLNYVPTLTRGGPDLLDEMLRHARMHSIALIGADRREPVTTN